MSDEDVRPPADLTAAMIVEMPPVVATEGETSTATTGGRSDSMARRYAVKLGANGMSTASGIAIQVVVVRALGPVAYGDYTFLTNFFTQVVDFFDVGSIGFYTKLSARQHDDGLVRFYLGFLFAVALALLGLTLAVLNSGQADRLWPGQQSRFVLMALAFAWLTWLARIVGQVVDAFGLTVPGEAYRAAQRLATAAILVALGLAGLVTLASYFAFQYVALLVLVGLWMHVLHAHGKSLVSSSRLSAGAARGYASELKEYATPLFVTASVGLVSGLASRWLLQTLAGSTQQGYFGLSSQIGAICFLFTSSLTPIWTREMSIAYARDDRETVRRLFSSFVPALYAIAAFAGVFIAIEASRLTLLFGGAAFKGAGLTVSLMALYPIHQTYGQLSGTMLLVRGKTRLYRNISLVTTPVGLLLMAWLIAPATRGGMALGSVGLAIGTLVMQFAGVNAQLWSNAADLRMSFPRLLLSQITTIGMFALIGGASFGVATGLNLSPLLHVALTAALYLALVMGTLLTRPAAFGISREAVQDAGRRIGSLTSRMRRP